MGAYVKRVQAVLTEAEFQELVSLSEEKGKAISVLIREAIEETYFKTAVAEKRQAALKSLLSLDAPVSDWPQMEQETIRDATGG